VVSSTPFDMNVSTFRLSSLLLMAALVWILGSNLEARAVEIELVFEGSGGARYPNVGVFGQCDLNAKAVLTSDAQGRWKFDTNELSCTDAIIAFSGVRAGVQLQPAELSVADLVSQGVRSKKILAIPSSRPSTVLSWSLFSSYSTRLAGLPVGLLNPYGYSASTTGSSCTMRRTDPNGYVLWSVPKASAACNDSSPSTSWYHIVPAEDSQMQCSTFTTAGSSGARACPMGDVQGVSTATCSVVSPPAQSLSSTIKVSIKAAGTTYGVLGAELVGNSNFMALAGRQTNSLGEYSFKIGNVPGAQPSTSFDIAPVRFGYEFFPRMRNTRECVHVGNNTFQCEFSAVPTNAGQGAVLVDIKQAGQPLSGAQLIPPDGGLGCNTAGISVSDVTGAIVVPVRMRTSCPTTTAWNEAVKIYPSMKGKAFLSASNFRYCPTTLTTTAAITAYDDNSAVQNYLISGRVLDVTGSPLRAAEIYVNGAQAALTSNSGDFSLGPYAQGSSVSVEARSGSLLFDPVKQTFLEVGSDHQLVIHARAPDPYSAGTDPPEEICPVQSTYVVSGLVLDLQGRPLAGAQIFSNDQQSPAAVSDSTGRYSLTLAHGSDTWVAIEHGSKKFSPSGRAINALECDELNADFQEVVQDSVLLSGFVTDSNGDAMAAVSLSVWIQGMLRADTLKTAADGSYRLAVPQGAAVGIAASRSGFNFTPNEIGLDALADETLAPFVGVATLEPTPISAPPSAPPSVPVAPPSATATPNVGIPTPTQTPVPPLADVPLPMPPVQPSSAPLPGDPGAAPPPPTPQQPVAPDPIVVPPTDPQPTAAPTAPGSLPGTPSDGPVAPDARRPTAIPTSSVNIGLPIAGPLPTPIGSAPDGTAPPSLPGQPPAGMPPTMPKVAVHALCDSPIIGSLDWVIENTSQTTLLLGNVYVQVASQTNVKVFEGSIPNLAPGERVLFRSRFEGISLESYRLNIEAQIPGTGDFVSVSDGLVSWDPTRCVVNLPPSPTPLPTSAPGEIAPTPAAPPIDSPQPPLASPPTPFQPSPTQPTSPPLVQPPATEPPPLPTATPTVTATPEPTYRVTGMIRSEKRGVAIPRALMQRYIAAGAYVEIRGRNGLVFMQKIPFSALQNDTYETWLRAGSYRVTVQSPKNILRVTSLFKKNSQRAVVTVSERKQAYENVSFAVAFRSVVAGGGAP
jgi:protocatechuate 3,4-dioxygenase beta subunit